MYVALVVDQHGLHPGAFKANLIIWGHSVGFMRGQGQAVKQFHMDLLSVGA